MKIEQIKVKNYKAFRDVTFSDIPALAFIIGANGTGKTTLFDIFGFLRDSLKDNVRIALQKRGGFNEVVSRESEEPIEIELKFRQNIAGKDRLVTYFLQIALGSNKQPEVLHEVLEYKRAAYGSPFHFLDFRKGRGYAITNEEKFDLKDEDLEREEQQTSPDMLAIKGLGQFERFKASFAFRQFMENWHVSDFHIEQARTVQEAGYAEHLSISGDNTALVAQYIREHHPEIFQTILTKIGERVPGMESVEAETTVDGRVVLKFKDGKFKDPFVARYVSDGTMKMFAYMLLLYDPRPHPLLCIEEPENQLYPKLMVELVEELRLYAKRGKGQVIVSSHSPEVVNAAELDEVFWLVKKSGSTVVHRASESEDIKKLVDSGDKLGWLWRQGLLEEVDP